VLNRHAGRDISDLDYVNQFVRSFAAIFDCQIFVPRFIKFESAVHKYFPELEDWRLIPAHYFFSVKKGTVLAKIHCKLNDYRDQKMLMSLIPALERGERVFAVVGRYHVVTQEPVLRSIFGSELLAKTYSEHSGPNNKSLYKHINK
jgi:hypothetical protein